MPLPQTSTVCDLLATLVGLDVRGAEATVDPSAAWRCLCLFVTPEQEPVAIVCFDLPGVVSTATALVGGSVEDAADAVARGDIDGEVLDNFAEIANVMTGMLIGDRFPRVLLHAATALESGQWADVLGTDLPMMGLCLAMGDYPTGSMVVVDLADAPASAIPQVVRSLTPTNAATVVVDAQWRPYSFPKTTGISRDLLRGLRLKVDELANAMAAAFSAPLDLRLHQKVLQFHPKLWQDYATNIVAPSVLISFDIQPLDGRFVLSWPVNLAMTLVDLLLGGNGSPLTQPRNPSELDLELVGSLAGYALAEVARFFSPFAEVVVADVHLDLNVDLVPGVSSKNSFLVMWMSAEVAGMESQATLGVPMSAIRPFLPMIVGRTEETGGENRLVRDRLLDVPVEVQASFDPVSVRAVDLANLRVGDVISISIRRDAPARLLLDSATVAAVRPVRNGGRLSVQVLQGECDNSAGPARFDCDLDAATEQLHTHALASSL